MSFNIIQLSEDENLLVSQAKINNEQIITHAQNFISLILDFLSEVSEKSWIFIAFLTQFQKSLSLAFLSVLRRHDVQAQLMIRHALEACVLACYGLSNTNMKDFVEIDLDGSVLPSEGIRSKAYKWLEENYPDHSKITVHMKKIINNNWAHSNIVSSTLNFQYKKEEIITSFFDEKDDILIKQRLWWIANICMGVFDLIKKVSENYPLIKISDVSLDKFKGLCLKNDAIKEQLMNTPWFSNWL